MASTPETTEKKSIWQEFKEFLFNGDLVAIAVAFVMGLATVALINAFINDIFNGIVGLFMPTECTTDAAGKQVCKAQTFDDWVIFDTIRLGAFLNAVVTFFMTALVVFLIVKVYKRVTGRKLKSDGPSTNDLLQDQTAVLTEIRDSLRTRG